MLLPIPRFLPVPDLTGKQLGDYKILRRLGRGAMAQVYLAEQQSLARRVALKVLTNDLAGDPNYVERFQNEARAAAGLIHANIVQVYEVGCADGAHFIAQEYVPGKNLGEVASQQGRLQPGLVLDILRQGAAALHKAHQGGIVHRDIKPENLMLGDAGEVKVADFGLARANTPSTSQLTQVGVTMGTPLYMSPEQIEGRAVDVRSDLYSLGVTAYHLLAGEPPYKGDTPLSVAVQHLNNQTPLLADTLSELPVRFSQIVAKLMAKQPEKRYQSPGELLADLRELARQASVDGWAEGPENWALTELQALRDQGATTELGTLMKRAADLQNRPVQWPRRVAFIAGAVLLGSIAGYASRPTPLLPEGSAEVLAKPDVRQQLMHANVVNTEQAWHAVSQNFPDLDIRYEMMAQQGLARLYLRNENNAKALEVFTELFKKAGPAEPEVQRFAVAGLTVALVNLDEWEKAREAVSLFDFQHLVDLEAVEPEIAGMFNEAIDQLDDAE